MQLSRMILEDYLLIRKDFYIPRKQAVKQCVYHDTTFSENYIYI